MGSSTKDLLALSEGILSNRNPIKGTAAKVDPIIDDDLKEVIVPNSFVNQIVGFNHALQETSDPEKKQSLMPEFDSITEETILRERLETLVETLKKLLRETKDVMQEMTSCGMVGVNLSGKKAPVVRRDDTYPPKPKKKKNGSNRINKGIKKRS
tara:strand:- start:85 stop:546 length:462 start_codon:yes stop_codon:yes gene_type:complete